MLKHRFVPTMDCAANRGSLLALAALVWTGLTAPAPAQDRPVASVAPEQHFTIPPGQTTPVVLRTAPDASCDLHDADMKNSMRLYGNMEGYVRFHFTPNRDASDVHLQLDCTTPQGVTNQPLHLRVAASPTPDMPAPRATVPPPAGSKIRPALTEEAARLLTDQELLSQRYPPRPSASQSPEAYARWLTQIAQPAIILPPHSVSRSDISHATGVTEGSSSNSHWSGFANTGYAFTFVATSAAWKVPTVQNNCPWKCYSSAWTGLDGAPNVANQDVVQAGTEHDDNQMGNGYATSYYAWTEVVPQQPTAQELFTVDPGDEMFVFVFVGDAEGNMNVLGGYAWFTVTDQTSFPPQIYSGSTKIGSYGFAGSSAEWIVERPVFSVMVNGKPEGVFYNLSDYGSVFMQDANFVSSFGGGVLIPYNQFASTAQEQDGIETLQQIIMYGSYLQPWNDNNVMSTVSGAGGTNIAFTWKNFN